MGAAESKKIIATDFHVNEISKFFIVTNSL